MKKNIDFFVNNFFEYENTPCECRKETIFSSPGESPHYNLKVCSTAGEPLHFSYAAQKGLNLSGSAGGIISENILGQLLAIPNNDVDAAMHFFEKYGFLFPVSNDVYENIDCDALLTIINRIKATVMLMGTIAGKRDYKKMLICATYLLYSDPVTIELAERGYTTYKHPFTQLLREFNIMPDLSRNQEFFDTECISIEDTVINGINKLDLQELCGMCDGTGILGVSGSRDPLFKNLFAMYSNFFMCDYNLRCIIDFYYNYQRAVGIFDKIEGTRITYYTTPRRDNFSQELKDSLLKVAQIVISEELNYHLKNISPIFNPETMAPSWKLNSLLEALYFSIFYMKPGIELYKECENPNCKHQKYFLINATVTNKKYCCQACANAAAQRRSRQRKLSQT